MGAITNQIQHEKDTKELRDLAELVPVYSRHLSHHLRNSLAAIRASLEMAQTNLTEKNLQALQNDLTRATVAADHMEQDLREVSL